MLTTDRRAGTVVESGVGTRTYSDSVLVGTDLLQNKLLYRNFQLLNTNHEGQPKHIEERS